MKNFILTIGALILAATAVAAQSGGSSHISKDGQAAPQDANCAFTFSSGSGVTSIKYCVTGNGNIAQLEIPLGIPLISQISQLEGYGICDLSTDIAYSNWNGIEVGAWHPAIVKSHNAKSVKIARTTGDDIWTLTQTFTALKGAPAGVKFAMALTNNGSVPRDVKVVRYADMDVAEQIPNNFDATDNTAIAWNSLFVSGEPFGVVLQNLVAVPRVGFALAQNTADPPDACHPVDNSAPGLEQNVDGSVELVYSPTVRPHSTVTLTGAYKGR